MPFGLKYAHYSVFIPCHFMLSYFYGFGVECENEIRFSQLEFEIGTLTDSVTLQ